MARQGRAADRTQARAVRSAQRRKGKFHGQVLPNGIREVEDVMLVDLERWLCFWLCGPALLERKEILLFKGQARRLQERFETASALKLDDRGHATLDERAPLSPVQTCVARDRSR